MYHRVLDRLKDAKLTIGASLSMVAINLMYGDSLVVNSTDSLAKQMEMALPSAFGTPDATGVDVLDFGGSAAFTMAGLEAARRTTPLDELAVTAISAQMISCGTDALIDQTGLIHNATDVGSSAIGVAWAMKFLLDRTANAEDETAKRRWKAATVVFAGTLTLGAYAFLGGDDGKLDMISHASAFAVGAAAYKFGTWRRHHNGDTPSQEFIRGTAAEGSPA